MQAHHRCFQGAITSPPLWARSQRRSWPAAATQSGCSMPQPPAAAKLVCSCESSLPSLSPWLGRTQECWLSLQTFTSAFLFQALWPIMIDVDFSTFISGFYWCFQESQEIQASEHRWAGESAGTLELQSRLSGWGLHRMYCLFTLCVSSPPTRLHGWTH